MTIYDVAYEAGTYVAKVDAGRATPILLAGRPVRSFADGWHPRFIYADLTPVLLLELVHESGMEATWFLDNHLNRLGGDVKELSTDLQWFIRRRYLDRTDATGGTMSMHAGPRPNDATLRALQQLACLTEDNSESGEVPPDDLTDTSTEISADVCARIGLTQIRQGNVAGGLRHLKRAFEIRSLHPPAVYAGFAEAACETGDFEAVAVTFALVLNRVGWLLDLAVQSLVRSWLGRALYQMGNLSPARNNLAQAIGLSADAPQWALPLLERCSQQDLSVFTEELPLLLKIDVQLFGEYVTALLEQAETLPPAPVSRYSTMTLATYWIRAGIRRIVLDGTRRGEHRIQLERIGFAPDFLDPAYEGPKQVARRCAMLSTDLPFAGSPQLTDRMFDVVGTTILRGKPILCPFTGTRAVARDSIDLSVCLYRHQGRICVIISGDSASHAMSDCAWFLPQDWLLLVSGRWPSVDGLLIRALARVFDNRELVVEYLAEANRPVMIADVAVGHLGHYIWNAITGWPVLLELSPPGSTDIIATDRSAQIFGGVKDLYPELVGQSGKLIELDNEPEFYAAMLRHKAIGLFILDRHVRQDLAKRVIGWCHDHCSSDFLAHIAALKAERRPLLLITLRLDNRAWVEQATGLPEIINRLATDFERFGVVLDGLNADINSYSSHAFMSLEAEQELAKNIIASCPGVYIENTIGCTPAEGIIWADTIEVFLAPVGAGMAKYRWITNKPGVAYSNETCLTPGEANGHLYEECRDDLVPMKYIELEDVTDVDKERHGERFRANFSMSWQAPYRKIKDMMARLFPESVRPPD